MTAATPTRVDPFSGLFSTRTTLPIARINTSEPRVTSEGSVSVISSSAPAFRSWSIVKYTPRVEMSRVFPLRADSFSTGIRMTTGRERSYRRAVRRSVIVPWTPVAMSRTHHAHTLSSRVRAISIPKRKTLASPNSVFSSASSFSIAGKTAKIGFPPNFHHLNTWKVLSRAAKNNITKPAITSSEKLSPKTLLTIADHSLRMKNSRNLRIPNTQLIAVVVALPVSAGRRQ